MPSVPCLRCNRLTTGTYCARCKPSRTGRPRPFTSGWAATRWREDVIDKYHHRCAVIGCERTDVEAHHLHPIHAGGEPMGEGIALCAGHHRAMHDPAYAPTLDTSEPGPWQWRRIA